LDVAGAGDQMIFSGRTLLAAYTPGTRLPPIVGFGSSGKADGAQIYSTVCVTCHQADGAGVPHAFPPLKESDFLINDKKRAIQIVTAGLQGEIMVNGEKYNSVMPNPKLNDEQIAAALTYVLSNFGNPGGQITAEEVSEVRKGFDASVPLKAEPAWATAPSKQARR
jgi:nitrite reductase (NO-forming)